MGNEIKNTLDEFKKGVSELDVPPIVKGLATYRAFRIAKEAQYNLEAKTRILEAQARSIELDNQIKQQEQNIYWTKR